MKNIVGAFMAALLLIGLGVAGPGAKTAAAAPIKDVTSTLQYLGQPSNMSTYARNVWDLQEFCGKIYVGSGNSSNEGPSSNAGPTPIIYYNPAQNTFGTEKIKYNGAFQTAVDDEQIDAFEVLNGLLYIPGHDPLGSWTFGDFYRMKDDSFVKHRDIPGAIHTFDMEYYKGRLFAAVGAAGYAAVMMSSDNGATWKLAGKINDGFNAMRAYDLFIYKQELYAAPDMWVQSDGYRDKTSLLKIDSHFKAKQIPVSAAKLTGPAFGATKMVHSTSFHWILFYIDASVYNDEQMKPLSLNMTTDFKTVTHVELPKGGVPVDINVRNNILYVLAYIENFDGTYTNIVYQTSDGKKWSETLEFTTYTFARSFEKYDGYFYFGMGSYMDLLPASTGKIYRVKM